MNLLIVAVIIIIAVGGVSAYIFLGNNNGPGSTGSTESKLPELPTSCSWTGTQIREFSDLVIKNPQFDAAGNTLSIDVSKLKDYDATLDRVEVSGYATGSLTVVETLNKYPDSKRFSITVNTNVKPNDCYEVDMELHLTINGNEPFVSSGKIRSVAS